MSTPLPLERRIFRSRQEDGLLDLVLGLGIIAFGVDRWLDSGLVVIVTLVFSLPIWKVLRHRFVEERIGRVRFGAERRASLQRARHGMLIGLVLSTLAGAGAWFWITRSGAGASELRAPLGVALAALIAGLGVGFEQRRFFLYALLVFGAFLGAGRFGGREVLPWWLVGAGLLILVSGCTFLVRFATAHPPVGGEPDHDLC